jgi:hypothetical protein
VLDCDNAWPECLVLLGVWWFACSIGHFFFAFPVFVSKLADFLLTSDQRTLRVASCNFQVED